MRAWAAQARAAVMPGTISNATSASSRASAASEDKGITAFEAHDPLAFPTEPDQQGADIGLLHAVICACLADIDSGSVASRHVQHVVGHETVVNDNVSLAEQALRAQRQQVGCSRPGANQVDHPGPRGRTAVVELVCEQGGGFAVAIGKDEVGDAACEDIFQHAPAYRYVGHVSAQLGPETICEGGQPTVGGRYHGLDAAAENAGEHRSCPGGGYSDCHRVAVDH